MGKQWLGGWIVGVCYDTRAKENAKSFLECTASGSFSGDFDCPFRG